jgi:WD40 repeat protein
LPRAPDETYAINLLFQTHPVFPTVYALGSFSKTLGVYMEPNGVCLCLLNGQVGGITHIKFTPDGSKILAGGRKDSEILVWDMRNPGQLYCTLNRTANTNQVRNSNKCLL